MKLEDDLSLRQFFIDSTYADLLKKCNGKDMDLFHLLDFVRKSKIIPVSLPGTSDSPFFNYIAMLANKANNLFTTELERELSHVCEKAERIGVLSLSS
ncbi:hypothetical protein [Methanococcoides alaskense]|uniref:Uncharacterized protein n=1 Tax=Methanococcoides alaskense TaxID=325778 RepID=A0AA90Z6Z5_9EURY|nr:hypothetical protein [Methanococcoides alaskense]MDA0524901.1 hypothetical protein [Methanococcoides alaskense]MDR6222184.1 hypothetical protein [Methanococcoides alaskense]